MGKEKTEFIARIAEQSPPKEAIVSESDDLDENVSKDQISNIMEQIIEVEEGKDNKMNDLDEEKHDEVVIKEDNVSDDEHPNDENQEFKYSDIKSSKSQKQRTSVSRRRHKKQKKKKKSSTKPSVDWNQYPVFKPRDINDRRIMSNKYTIWIDNLQPNTTYLLRLRGLNKYGYGDWTKIYSFITKLTSFEFKSCIIKEAAMKNAVFEILCKKLINSSNDASIRQFALKRIFNSEIDGFSSKKFHELVDEKKRILLIAESENGQVFGGYTDSSWTAASKTDKWRNDANAFLFLLRNGKKQSVAQIFDCIDPYNATRSNINSGPCFGQGFDLLICDNCNKVDNSYSVPKSYDIPSNVFIGGKKNFKIKNYECYMVV